MIAERDKELIGSRVTRDLERERECVFDKESLRESDTLDRVE